MEGVELPPLPSHPIGVNELLARACEEHAALLEEYRVALHDWRVARTNDPLNSQCDAVLAAIQRVEELENKIKTHQSEHGCWHDVPLQADL